MACAVVEKLQSCCLRLKGSFSSNRHNGLGKQKTKTRQISNPYNFKHLSGVPDGFDVDQMNVLREKAAASRLIPIEDHSQSRPSSAGGGAPQISYFVNSQQPHHHQVKTRAGYRGLASSSAANGNRGGGLHYSAQTTESRPSVTRSFAAIDDNATALTPTSSASMSTSSMLSPSSSADGRRERRMFASSI